MTETTDPRKQLEQAQQAHFELAADLARLDTALQAAEGDLRIARRKGASAKDLAARGTQVASLRAIVEDQRVDVAEAAAVLERARFAARRFEATEAARLAAEVVERCRAEIAGAVRDLPAAVAGSVARMAAAAERWRAAFDEHAGMVAELRVISAEEAGAEPPTPTQALADEGAWAAAARELEAAGVDPAAFRDHPLGFDWYHLRYMREGVGPAFQPRAFVVPLPELVAALTTDPEAPAPEAWSIQDAPTLARLVAEAVLAGDLDGAARPVERTP